MGNNQTEKAFEEKRLAQTISLAEEQLKQAKEAADKKKSEIIEAKKDVRENTEHGITSLYTSDGFEALVELSQYINPVTDKIIKIFGNILRKIWKQTACIMMTQ